LFSQVNARSVHPGPVSSPRALAAPASIAARTARSRRLFFMAWKSGPPTTDEGLEGFERKAYA
jgi:hypothetical protein